MFDIDKLKKGDKVLVECTVDSVFTESGMVCVTARDIAEGFDAYTDEIIDSKERLNTQIQGLIDIAVMYKKQSLNSGHCPYAVFGGNRPNDDDCGDIDCDDCRRDYFEKYKKFLEDKYLIH